MPLTAAVCIARPPPDPSHVAPSPSGEGALSVCPRETDPSSGSRSTIARVTGTTVAYDGGTPTRNERALPGFLPRERASYPMNQNRPYLVHAWPEQRWWMVAIPELDVIAQVTNRSEVEAAARELIAESASRSRRNAGYIIELFDGPPPA